MQGAWVDLCMLPYLLNHMVLWGGIHGFIFPVCFLPKNQLQQDQGTLCKVSALDTLGRHHALTCNVGGDIVADITA